MSSVELLHTCPLLRAQHFVSSTSSRTLITLSHTCFSPPITKTAFSSLSLKSPTNRLNFVPKSSRDDEEEVIEDDEFESGSASEEETELFDADALEEEARIAAKEYSLSLSRELTIEDANGGKQLGGGKQKRRKSSSGNSVPDHLLPRVTIVGRPNVGKSALFNRLVGGNNAIVVDEPGVTRDRLYGRSFWGPHEFMVVDTGGVVTVSKLQANVMEDLAISTSIGMDEIPMASRNAAVARMPSMIERQATAAVEEASVILFLVDGQILLVLNRV